MSEILKRFLDLVTGPLTGHHEQNARARQAIRSMLKPKIDGELEEASKRLETSDRSKWKPAWVGLGLVLFGMGLLGLNVSKWLREHHFATYMLGLGQFIIPDEGYSEKKAELTKLVVLGRPVRDQLLIKNDFDKLQDLYPSDPLYFAPRSLFRHDFDRTRSVESLSALLDRNSKIDPDNGWWPYIEATVVSWNLDLVVKPASGKLLEWKPEKQERVDLLLRHFRQAAAAPRFESYQTAINSRKIALLPPADTVQDCLLNLIYFPTIEVTESFSLLDEIVITQAQILADQKDIPGFKILLNEWIKLERAKVNDFNQMEDLSSRTSSLRMALPRFQAAAQQLDLHEEVQALEESIAILDQQNRPYSTNKANQQALRLHGSQLTSALTTSMSTCGLSGDYFHGRYPLMTKERLKPNRRSEHAYVAQLLILPLGGLLLAVSTCLFAFRFRNGRLSRELSGRFTGLFDRSDWLHCLGFGVMLPMLYFAVVRYFTPFGGLDWFEGSVGHHLERMRLLLLFLLIVSCSVLVLRRKLRARMSFYELNDRRGRIGLILTIAGFAILPLLGCCIQIERDQFVRPNMAMIYLSLLVMGCMLIWLIASAIRCLLGNPEQALRRQILARLMARTMIWAFALVCATLPLHKAEEQFWMKRDTVVRPDSNHPATTRYEWEVIQQMKSEMLEILTPMSDISR